MAPPPSPSPPHGPMSGTSYSSRRAPGLTRAATGASRGAGGRSRPASGKRVTMICEQGQGGACDGLFRLARAPSACLPASHPLPLAHLGLGVGLAENEVEFGDDRVVGVARDRVVRRRLLARVGGRHGGGRGGRGRARANARRPAVAEAAASTSLARRTRSRGDARRARSGRALGPAGAAVGTARRRRRLPLRLATAPACAPRPVPNKWFSACASSGSRGRPTAPRRPTPHPPPLCPPPCPPSTTPSRRPRAR